MVERGFELSEASNTPVMMELRIRACHVRGSFATKKNLAPAVSTRNRLDGPPKEFIYDRLAHPPAIFRQEKLKSEVRLPAARKFVLDAQRSDDKSLAAPGARRHDAAATDEIAELRHDALRPWRRRVEPRQIGGAVEHLG